MIEKSGVQSEEIISDSKVAQMSDAEMVYGKEMGQGERHTDSVNGIKNAIRGNM